jgi:hypothetical protein
MRFLAKSHLALSMQKPAGFVNSKSRKIFRHLNPKPKNKKETLPWRYTGRSSDMGTPSQNSVIFEKYFFGQKKILKNYKNWMVL